MHIVIAYNRNIFSAGNCLFKVNKRSMRPRYEIS